MMIPLYQAVSREDAGGKAATLSELKRLGFSVPDGFVLTRAAWRAAKSFDEQLCVLPEEIRALLTPNPEGFISPEKLYAVRSSGLLEDLAQMSFAGQYETVLNVPGGETDAMANAVLRCYRSASSAEVTAYLEQNNIRTEPEMAVLIQEMIPSEKSGVVFTVNPMTGHDHELLVEAAFGLGEALVQGRANAALLRYDWLRHIYTEWPDEPVLTREESDELCEVSIAIQRHFGFPCDIEFAFSGGILHILQSRPVTRIAYSSLNELWTTADFKDGGVSAAVYPPFMWSLYEYVWEIEFRNFLTVSGMSSRKALTRRKLGEMFFGRPYWNLGVTKAALSRVPGYKEREFDQEYGIHGNYTGDGQTTKLTPSGIFFVLRVALRQARMLRSQEKTRDKRKAALLEIYEGYLRDFACPRSTGEWEELCRRLILEDYLLSEGSYFNQIFLNTLRQGMFKDAIKGRVETEGYYELIGGLDRISHLSPFDDLWILAQKIRADAAALAWWKGTGADEIAKAAMAGQGDSFLPDFREFIMRYGYHSEHELDITWPCWGEIPELIVKELQQILARDEALHPAVDRKRQQEAYLRRAKELPKRLLRKTERMRALLWWREEFRDLSTRFYYLIRLHMMALANQYVSDGLLNDVADIWFLKVGDLWREADDGFPDRVTYDLETRDLRSIAERRKAYYMGYRNYLSENEIGVGVSAERIDVSDAMGLGCSPGTAVGTARVVSDLSEIERLQPGDILVTRFTDTGWTGKFAFLSGVVTEFGGALCHAAIVSREYGIPCVVCARDAMRRIPDGARVRIDGSSGEVVVL